MALRSPKRSSCSDVPSSINHVGHSTFRPRVTFPQGRGRGARLAVAGRSRRLPGRLWWIAAAVALAALFAGCGTTAWQPVTPSGDEIIVSLTDEAQQPHVVLAGGSLGTVYRVRSDSETAPVVAARGVGKGSVINALLSDPRAPHTIYAGTNAGLYLSSDDGSSWQRRDQSGFPTADAFETLAWGIQPEVLYAGSEEHGIYASVDGGLHWTRASRGLPPKANIYALLTDRASDTLYAGIIGQGIYKASLSASGPSSATTLDWSLSSSGLPANSDVFAILLVPQGGLGGSHPTLYAGTADGLYTSTDSGASWQSTGSGLPAARILALTDYPSRPGLLYAGTDSTVYQSTDAGRNWTLLASGLATHIAAIVAAPSSSGAPVLFAAGDRLARYPEVSAPSLTPLWLGLGVAFVVGVLMLLFGRRGSQEGWPEAHTDTPARTFRE